MTGGPWCDDCGETHPVTSRAGRDLCRGCADQYDTKNGQEEVRYRNPPKYYGVEAVPGMEDADPDA